MKFCLVNIELIIIFVRLIKLKIFNVNNFSHFKNEKHFYIFILNFNDIIELCLLDFVQLMALAMFSYQDYCIALNENNMFSTNLLTPLTIIIAIFLDRVYCDSSQFETIVIKRFIF